MNPRARTGLGRLGTDDRHGRGCIDGHGEQRDCRLERVGIAFQEGPSVGADAIEFHGAGRFNGSQKERVVPAIAPVKGWVRRRQPRPYRGAKAGSLERRTHD